MFTSIICTIKRLLPTSRTLNIYVNNRRRHKSCLFEQGGSGGAH